MKDLVLAAVFWLLFPVGGCGQSDDLSTIEAELWEQLMQNYKATVLPSVPGGVKVQVGIVLTGMEISTATESMELSGWWRLYWKDQRLAWNQSKWGVSSLAFKEGQIWAPDVTMYEKTQESLYAQERMVYSNGDVVMSTPRKSTFACPMSLSAFPFDVQKCRFTIGSWSHDGSRLEVLPRVIDPTVYFEESSSALPQRSPVEVQDLTNFHEFHLRAVRAVWRNNFYSCCKEPFPTIRVELEVERSTTTYVMGVITPLIIVTFIGFGTLFMPSASGSKPALCVTVLLTTATVYFVASQNTPNSNQTTLVGRLYLACLVTNLLLVFWSILSTALCLIQRDQSSSVQHFMDFFYHFDTDHNGRLDKEQVNDALVGLGLTPVEQNKLVHHLFDGEPCITEDQWAVIGELAHRSDKLAIYHNPIVEKVVTGAIIHDFKKHGANVGRSKLELYSPQRSNEASPLPQAETRPVQSHVAPEEATPTIQLSPTTPRRRNSTSQLQSVPSTPNPEREQDDNTDAYGSLRSEAAAGVRGIGRMAAVGRAVLAAQNMRRRTAGQAADAAASGPPAPAEGAVSAVKLSRRGGGLEGPKVAEKQEAEANGASSSRGEDAEAGAGQGRLWEPMWSLTQSNRSPAPERGLSLESARNWLEASGIHLMSLGVSPRRTPRSGSAVEITNPSPTKPISESRRDSKRVSIAASHVEVPSAGPVVPKPLRSSSLTGTVTDGHEHTISIADLRAESSDLEAQAQNLSLPPTTPRTPSARDSTRQGQAGGWEKLRREVLDDAGERAEPTPAGENAAPQVLQPQMGSPVPSNRSGGATLGHRLDVKLGCLQLSDLHFRQVLRKLGDKMDQFAGANRHPTSVGRRIAASGDSKGRLVHTPFLESVSRVPLSLKHRPDTSNSI